MCGGAAAPTVERDNDVVAPPGCRQTMPRLGRACAHAGRLLVAEHAGRTVGTVTFYDDDAAEGLGWPSGWAGVRALGVDPAPGARVGRPLT